MHATPSRRILVVAAAAVTALPLAGCYASTYPEPAVVYVSLTAAPADLSAYPRTYYDGRVVYLVNDRWIYRDGGRWAYYQRDPAPLYRQRAYIQQAPPAYRAYPQGAPGRYPGTYPTYPPG